MRLIEESGNRISIQGTWKSGEVETFEFCILSIADKVNIIA